jgi:predicted acylesterase/phospholipase RssA
VAYRILSLDGGGTWALLEARALARLYGADTPGPDILARFDLVAANSGGGLVAAALAAGRTPGQVAGAFLDPAWRARIFAPRSWLRRHLPTALLLGGPRYATDKKLPGIRAFLGPPGDRPLEGAASSFLFTAFDYDRNRAVFYRSRPDSLAATPTPGIPTLAEAVHASTTAPLPYFDAPAPVCGRRLWDGGVAGLNNPVLAAVTEALANGVPPEEIAVLSLGSASLALPEAPAAQAASPGLVLQRRPPGLVRDLVELATAVLADPPDSATFIAHTILSRRMPGPGEILDRGPLVRMSPLIQPVRDAQGRLAFPRGLPEADFNRLKKIDMDATEPGQVDLLDRFGALWLADAIPNQPIRADRELRVDIGHRWFSGAEAAWRALEGPAGS